jgi:hypothetical protein
MIGMPSEYRNKMLARCTSLSGAFRELAIRCNWSFFSGDKINFAFWLFFGILIPSNRFGNQYTTNSYLCKYFNETIY